MASYAAADIVNLSVLDEEDGALMDYEDDEGPVEAPPRWADILDAASDVEDVAVGPPSSAVAPRGRRTSSPVMAPQGDLRVRRVTSPEEGSGLLGVVVAPHVEKRVQSRLNRRRSRQRVFVEKKMEEKRRRKVESALCPGGEARDRPLHHGQARLQGDGSRALPSGKRPSAFERSSRPPGELRRPHRGGVQRDETSATRVDAASIREQEKRLFLMKRIFRDHEALQAMDAPSRCPEPGSRPSVKDRLGVRHLPGEAKSLPKRGHRPAPAVVDHHPGRPLTTRRPASTITRAPVTGTTRPAATSAVPRRRAKLQRPAPKPLPGMPPTVRAWHKEEVAARAANAGRLKKDPAVGGRLDEDRRQSSARHLPDAATISTASSTNSPPITPEVIYNALDIRIGEDKSVVIVKDN